MCGDDCTRRARCPCRFRSAARTPTWVGGEGWPYQTHAGTNRLKPKYDKLPSILLPFCFQFQVAALELGDLNFEKEIGQQRGVREYDDK